MGKSQKLFRARSAVSKYSKLVGHERGEPLAAKPAVPAPPDSSTSQPGSSDLQTKNVPPGRCATDLWTVVPIYQNDTNRRRDANAPLRKKRPKEKVAKQKPQTRTEVRKPASPFSSLDSQTWDFRQPLDYPLTDTDTFAAELDRVARMFAENLDLGSAFLLDRDIPEAYHPRSREFFINQVSYTPRNIQGRMSLFQPRDITEFRRRQAILPAAPQLLVLREKLDRLIDRIPKAGVAGWPVIPPLHIYDSNSVAWPSETADTEVIRIPLAYERPQRRATTAELKALIAERKYASVDEISILEFRDSLVLELAAARQATDRITSLFGAPDLWIRNPRRETCQAITRALQSAEIDAEEFLDWLIRKELGGSPCMVGTDRVEYAASLAESLWRRRWENYDESVLYERLKASACWRISKRMRADRIEFPDTADVTAGKKLAVLDLFSPEADGSSGEERPGLPPTLIDVFNVFNSGAPVKLSSLQEALRYHKGVDLGQLVTTDEEMDYLRLKKVEGLTQEGVRERLGWTPGRLNRVRRCVDLRIIAARDSAQKTIDHETAFQRAIARGQRITPWPVDNYPSGPTRKQSGIPGRSTLTAANITVRPCYSD